MHIGEDVAILTSPLLQTGRTTFTIPTPSYLTAGAADAVGSVKTPMPCKISQVLVKPGDKVEKDAPLIILEAMKMEHIIRSPFSGTIDQVLYTLGDMVAENKSLVTFADDKQQTWCPRFERRREALTRFLQTHLYKAAVAEDTVGIQ